MSFVIFLDDSSNCQSNNVKTIRKCCILITLFVYFNYIHLELLVKFSSLHNDCWTNALSWYVFFRILKDIESCCWSLSLKLKLTASFSDFCIFVHLPFVLSYISVYLSSISLAYIPVPLPVFHSLVLSSQHYLHLSIWPCRYLFCISLPSLSPHLCIYSVISSICVSSVVPSA